MKSISTSKSNPRAPSGMGDVVSPWALTYSGTCHQWLSIGASSNLVLPMICDHMCMVRHVDSQPGVASWGHPSASALTFTVHPLRHGTLFQARAQQPRPVGRWTPSIALNELGGKRLAERRRFVVALDGRDHDAVGEGDVCNAAVGAS